MTEAAAPEATVEDLADIPAGPALSAALHALPLSRVPNDRILEWTCAQHRLSNHEQARATAVLYELARCDGGSAAGRVSRTASAGEFAAHESRAALRWTHSHAESEHAFAEFVVGHLPDVFAVWSAGVIDRARVRVFEQYLYGLYPEQIASVCAAALPHAADLTTGQLGALLKRLVIGVDPDAAARWYRRRVRERGVCAYLAPDGTVTITAHGLPADQAQAACERVGLLADAARRAGHPGRIAQIRADVHLGLLDGRLHGLDTDQIIATLIADHHTAEEASAAERADGRSDSSRTDFLTRLGRLRPPSRESRGSGVESTDGTGRSRDRSEPAPCDDSRDSDEPSGDGRRVGHGSDGSRGYGADDPDREDREDREDGTDHDDRRDRENDTRSDGRDGTDDPGGTDDPDGDGTDDPDGGGPSGPDGDLPRGPAGSDRPDDPGGDGAPEDPTDGSDPTPPGGDRGEPGVPSAGPHNPDDQRRGIEIRIALSTMLGIDDHPGEIPGLGPVPAHVARARALMQTRAEWRFAVTSADGTRLLSEGHTRRRPAGATRAGPPPGGIVELQVDVDLLARLAAVPGITGEWSPVVADMARQHADRDAHLVELDARPGARLPTACQRRHTEIRDRTCGFAGVCRRPAHHSQQDHRLDHALGGATVVANLGPMCAMDHLVRHRAGWTPQPCPDGGVRWRSPLGGRYRSRAEFLTTPMPHQVRRPAFSTGAGDPLADLPERPILDRPPRAGPRTDHAHRTDPDDDPPF